MRITSGVRLAAVVAAAGLALTACGRAETPSPSASGEPTDTAAPTTASIIVGTSDKVRTIDPAGSYDHGSLTVEIQVYQFLYGFVGDGNAPVPDAAESCDFTEPTIFECTLKPDLKFANGHDLTSSDVKFSFDRIVKINDENGPASLLGNLESVAAPDPLTVQFTLKAPNDQTWVQVLATSAGPIVDEEVLSPDALTPDEDIVAANAFSGPYTITSYNVNDTIEFTPYEGYQGGQPTPANPSVTLKTFTDATNLKLSITNGDIDVAYRSLTPTDIESLQGDSNVTVWQAKGGEIRYIVFNLETQPGDTPEQKFAVRQAVASLVDRDALSTSVYKGQYIPLYSYVPDGYVGATTAVGDAYPLSTDAAAKYLSDAGVSTPVELNLQYNPDHYGSSSDQEYGLIKQQLESSGLFTVNLQSTEWVTYSKERVADAYPAYQLGWFPDFPDADNYLNPFFNANNFLANHFDAKDIQDLITAEVTETDPAARQAGIEEIQKVMAEKYLSTLPLLQGSQWAFSGTDVTGISLGASENLSFVGITKG